ncbi:protein kinase family protein [Candidatus Margulisiibacteriota bacterium]
MWKLKIIAVKNKGKPKRTKRKAKPSKVQDRIMKWVEDGRINLEAPIHEGKTGNLNWTRWKICSRKNDKKTPQKRIGVFTELRGGGKSLRIIQFRRPKKIFGKNNIRTVIEHGKIMILSTVFIKFYDIINGSEKKKEYSDSAWDKKDGHTKHLSVITTTMEKGGFSKGYQAGDNTFVKKPKDKLNINHPEDWQKVINLIREAEMLAKLSRGSDYFVKFDELGFCVDEAGNLEIMLRMEKMQGNLSDMPAESRSEYFESVSNQCTRAVEYLRTKNIVHRDIKPKNILYSLNMDKSITVKFCDVGSASSVSELQKSLIASCTEGKADAGSTMAYIAPEIIVAYSLDTSEVENHCKKIGAETDIWSLGVTLLEFIHSEKYYDLLKLKEDNFSYMNFLAKENGVKVQQKITAVFKKHPQPMIQAMLEIDPEKRKVWEINLFLMKNKELFLDESVKSELV